MEFADDQASSRLVLDDGTILTKCMQCETAYSERDPPEEPPCDTCMVDLDPVNREAASIYQAVRSQVLTMFNGERVMIIDLNHLAIKMHMDLNRVVDQKGCFNKVVDTFHYFNKKAQE